MSDAVAESKSETVAVTVPDEAPNAVADDALFVGRQWLPPIH